MKNPAADQQKPLSKLPSASAQGALSLLSGVSRFVQKAWQRWIWTPHTVRDLQVWQRCDRTGSFRWYAYDPKSGQRAKCLSEEQMRVWIERLHQSARG